MTKNLLNGKKYIGKDAKNNPNYLGSGLLLKKAINKYGKHNFEKVILKDNIITLEELDKSEIYFIDFFDAVNDKTFYNIASGGGGGDTFTNNPNKEITRLKCKASYKKPILNDKQKQAISDRVVKEIFQFDMEGNLIKHFKSLEEAKIELKLKNKGHLSRAASGKTNAIYGYRWSYTNIPNNIIIKKIGRNIGTKNSYKIKRNHINIHTRKIECYKDNELLITFNSYQDGADYFKISKEHFNQVIIRCDKGFKYKKAYYFIKGEKIKKTKYVKL